MLHDPGILCGCSAGFKFYFARWMLSGEDDASDFTDDALEVFQSARRWVYPGYLYFNILNGYLGYFSSLTKGKNRYFK